MLARACAVARPQACLSAHLPARRYAAELNSQPALVANERRLREKITLMCLMEMISSLPAENRNIALPAIAQQTKLDVDGVEFLLMKVGGVGTGSLDQG